MKRWCGLAAASLFTAAGAVACVEEGPRGTPGAPGSPGPAGTQGPPGSTALDPALGLHRNLVVTNDVDMPDDVVTVTFDALQVGSVLLKNGTVSANTSLVGSAGGILSAEVPSFWYAVMVIADSANPDSHAAFLVTESQLPLLAAADLPSGFDTFRRVGWIRNSAASVFRRTRQAGDRVWFMPENSTSDASNAARFLVNAQSNMSLAEANPVAHFPPGAREVMVRVLHDCTTSGAAAVWNREGPVGTAVNATDTVSQRRLGRCEPDAVNLTATTLTLNDSGRFFYGVSAASSSVSITAEGYIDEGL